MVSRFRGDSALKAFLALSLNTGWLQSHFSNLKFFITQLSNRFPLHARQTWGSRKKGICVEQARSFFFELNLLEEGKVLPKKSTIPIHANFKKAQELTPKARSPIILKREIAQNLLYRNPEGILLNKSMPRNAEYTLTQGIHRFIKRIFFFWNYGQIKRQFKAPKILFRAKNLKGEKKHFFKM